MDPNMFACKDWKDLSEQLIDSKARIDFNQGVDLRVLTEEKIEYIKRMRLKMIHFAWDRYQDKDIIIPKLKQYMEQTGGKRWNTMVYVLSNFDTTIEQDYERIMTIRELGADPYLMIYRKETAPKELRHMQRWCNNKLIFRKVSFEEYDNKKS